VLAAIAACAWLEDALAAEVCAAVAIAAGLAGASMGVTAAAGAYHPPLLRWYESGPALADTPVVVEGVLREDAALTGFGGSLVLDVGRVSAGPRGWEVRRGGVRLAVIGAAVPAHAGAWRAGRRMRAPALLRLPAEYRNFGAPDQRRALARRGIVLVGTVKSATLVEVIGRGSPLEEAAGAVRAWTREVLARRVGRHSPRSGGVATAILIGDRTGLPEEDERRLQEAGTYHVIAISGGNIAILTVALLVALKLLGTPPRVAAAVAIAALLFYGQLTGAPASVARAVTAAVVYLAGRALDQRGPPLNALAVAAVLSLGVSPLAILDPGFILSFGATLGILIGTPRVMARVTARTPARLDGASWSRRLARRATLAAAGMAAATACAEAVLAPAGAALFGRVTLAGLVLNFAAIPLMTLAQLSALATLGVEPLSAAAARAAGVTTHGAAFGLVESARLVDVLPWLSRDLAPPAWPVIAAYYMACGAVLVRGRSRLALAALAASATVIVAGPACATRGAVAPRPGLLRAVFLDVGQGDATLVTLPDGRALLVDAAGAPGTSFDMGARVVVPALRVLGVRRLEELVVTHGDPDHVGGALGVAQAFRPRVIREGAPVPPHAGLRELRDWAAQAGAVWRTVQAGDADRAGGVEIRVLHPPMPEWERQRVRNDDSVVLEFRLGDVSVVLPGDIGHEPERALVPRLALAPLVVLKAPHHGSATSSTPAFLRAVRPAAVVVSAGRNNRFGHPAPVVVGRYRTAGAALFRTDEDGAVVVETDGKTVWVRTWSGRSQEIRTSGGT
jgi:competence protein ComEC